MCDTKIQPEQSESSNKGIGCEGFSASQPRKPKLNSILIAASTHNQMSTTRPKLMEHLVFIALRLKTCLQSYRAWVPAILGNQFCNGPDVVFDSGFHARRHSQAGMDAAPVVVREPQRIDGFQILKLLRKPGGLHGS